jgi:DNA-binding NarL/FixJ family response regulator
MIAPMRVVVAEDQALLREGVVRLLQDAGFDVVAEAVDAPDLLRKVGAHKPDVAIVDVQMPPDNTDDGHDAAGAARVGRLGDARAGVARSSVSGAQHQGRRGRCP